MKTALKPITTQPKLSTDGFSTADVKQAFILSGIAGYYTGHTVTRKRAIAARFTSLDGHKCCTFLSKKVLFQAKMEKFRERRQQVQFTSYSNSTQSGTTSKGYRVTLDSCTCKDYQDGSKYALYVNGQKTCKHQAQMMHVYFGAMNIRDMVEVRLDRRVLG